MNKSIDEKINKIKESRIRKILFDRPVLKFIIFIIINFILIETAGYIPGSFPTRIFINIINIMIAVYFVFAIINIIKTKISELMNPKNLLSLIFSYALFILVVILIFSTIFNLIELTHQGYIKYGICEDDFNSSMISTDQTISHDFFYFASITFFSLGYGDICPMGLSKILSIIVAFTGHLVSVVLVALIINNYLKIQEKKEVKLIFTTFLTEFSS